jgi:membrane protein implicated in regulation of membrane protease activity
MNVSAGRAPGLIVGVVCGAAALALVPHVPPIEAVLIVFSITAFVQVAGVYFGERAQAKQARGVPAGLFKLVGAEGTVVTPCAPSGTIRIGFELWDARCASGHSLAAGERVVVRAVEGKTLVVDCWRILAGEPGPERRRAR